MNNLNHNLRQICRKYTRFRLQSPLSSLIHQFPYVSLDNNGLGQQQLFARESFAVRNPKSGRERFQFASSITKTIYGISGHFERGSSQDYLTEITGPQRELANFKSGFGGILEMTTAYYYRYCKYECGQLVTFQDNVISKNGRKIPLQENGLPHDCPNSLFRKRQQQLARVRSYNGEGTKIYV